MMLHQGLKQELTTNPLTAPFLAGEGGRFDRIFPSINPQKVPNGTKTVPCVLYEQADLGAQTGYCGRFGVVRTQMRLDCVSKTYDEAKSLAKAVRMTLSDFRGMLGGIVDTRTATLENEFDVADFEPGLYRVTQTWSFWHVE